MATLLLTSTGISSNTVCDAFLNEIGDHRNLKIFIITNAASEGKENKYARLAESQFIELGFLNISFFDVEKDALSRLYEADIIYVVGGNTFTLLHKIRRSGADKVLTTLLSTAPDLIYIGVSAGSIILTPTIRIASEVEPDPNEEDMSDFSALSIFRDEIYPHYTEDIETELCKYENRHSVTVRRITNEEALLVKNNDTRLVS